MALHQCQHCLNLDYVRADRLQVMQDLRWNSHPSPQRIRTVSPMNPAWVSEEHVHKAHPPGMYIDF